MASPCVSDASQNPPFRPLAPNETVSASSTHDPERRIRVGQRDRRPQPGEPATDDDDVGRRVARQRWLEARARLAQPVADRFCVGTHRRQWCQPVGFRAWPSRSSARPSIRWGWGGPNRTGPSSRPRRFGPPASIGSDGPTLGDLDIRIPDHDRDPATGVVGIDGVLTSTDGIRRAILASVAQGRRPFVLGGCCALLPGALAGARDAVGPLGLVYVDGHLDFYDGVTSPTGEAADMPIAVVLGDGPPPWVERCGPVPVIEPPAMAILGYHDTDELADIGDQLPARRALRDLRCARDTDPPRGCRRDRGRRTRARPASCRSRLAAHRSRRPRSRYLRGDGLPDVRRPRVERAGRPGPARGRIPPTSWVGRCPATTRRRTRSVEMDGRSSRRSRRCSVRPDSPNYPSAGASAHGIRTRRTRMRRDSR